MSIAAVGFEIFARDQASSTFRRVAGSMDKTERKTHRLRTAMVAVAATAGFMAIKFGIDAVKGASDLHESMTKTEAVFGSSSKTILRWSKTTAASMGLSQTATLDAASNFAILGKTAGLTGHPLAGFSKQMVHLAGDLASFSNTTPEQAVQALGSALRGQSRPLRAYGVLIDAASLKAEALRIGLIKAQKDKDKILGYQVRLTTTQKAWTEAVRKHGKTSEVARKAEGSMALAHSALKKAEAGTVPVLTAQQKVLAARSLIMKQTTTQQGDFARTSHGLANQQRILTAELANTRDEIGAHLLPIAVKVANFLTGTLIPGIGHLSHWISQNKTTTKLLVGALAALWVTMKVGGGIMKVQAAGGLLKYLKATKLVTGATKVWTVVQAAFNAVMNHNVLAIVILGLVALGAAVVVAYKKSATFRRIVHATFRAVGIIWRWLWRNVLKPGFAALKVELHIIGRVVHWLWQHGFAPAFHGIAVVGSWMWKHVLKPMFGAFKIEMRIVATVVRWLWTHGVAVAFHGIAVLASWLWKHVLKPAFHAWTVEMHLVGVALGTLWHLVSKAWDKITGFFKTGIKWIVSHFVDAVGAILKGAARMFGWVPGIGKKLKTASDKFDAFKKRVNTSLGGIKNRDITVHAGFKRGKFGLGSSPFGPGHKRGGLLRGPGTGTSDSIPIRGSNGEFIVNAKATRENLAVLQAINASGSRVGRPPLRDAKRNEVDAFANGGLVSLRASGLNAAARGAASYSNHINSLITGMAKTWARALLKAAMKAIRAASAGGGHGGLSSVQVARGQRFARAQAGKPYIWGGVGPRGYDCSGFVGAVLNAALGRNPYHRLGSTGTMPWPGFRMGGGGAYQVGWFNGSPGHTSGTLGNLKVESTDSSVRVGAAARGAHSSLFNHIMSFKGYDTGGMLMPGWTMAYNGTGHPERVSRHDEPIQVHVFLDGREIRTSLLRVRRHEGGAPLGIG